MDHQCLGAAWHRDAVARDDDRRFPEQVQDRPGPRRQLLEARVTVHSLQRLARTW